VLNCALVHRADRETSLLICHTYAIVLMVPYSSTNIPQLTVWSTTHIITDCPMPVTPRSRSLPTVASTDNIDGNRSLAYLLCSQARCGNLRACATSSRETVCVVSPQMQCALLGHVKITSFPVLTSCCLRRGRSARGRAIPRVVLRLSSHVIVLVIVCARVHSTIFL
jgi:hypothetical protein